MGKKKKKLLFNGKEERNEIITEEKDNKQIEKEKEKEIINNLETKRIFEDSIVKVM